MSTSIIRDHYGLKPEVFKRLYGPYIHKPLFVCQVSQLQPRSQGVVTLRSKNPYDPPIIDPNYLQDIRDVEDIVQGMKTCQRIGTSPPLLKLGARPFKTLIPGCEVYADDEDKYFTCQLRSIAISFHNAVGTAKMGDPKDDTTVVDPQLRVKSIKGLRVVDASIMPTIPSGNIMIPTIMIAEKASEMIKETIHCYRKESEENWEDEEIDSEEWFYETEGHEMEDINKWDKSHEVPWTNENLANISPKEHYSEYQWKIPENEAYTEHDKRSWNDFLKYSGEAVGSKKEHFLEEHVNVPLPEYKWNNNKYYNNNSWNQFQKYSRQPYWLKEDHVNLPPKHSSAIRGKYYMDDYIKSTGESPSIKDAKESFWKPYSWYKKQTELILKEISKIPYASSLEHKQIPMWKMPFKMSKSIDELVKLADMVPDQIDRAYNWDKTYAEHKIL